MFGRFDAIRVLEGVLGRSLLWRAGRALYHHARRDGRNDPAVNGEYALHRKLAQLAARWDRPLRVIDVGANIGYWSLHLLEECQAAGAKNVQLWAFEPSDDIRTRLIERLKAAPSSCRISIHHEAVANVTGTAAFDGSSGISGIKSLLTDRAEVEGKVPRIEVPVTTLAAVFSAESIEQADFVKSDVEGFDLFVIQGALPLLREGRIGLVQFEYNHRWIATRSFLRDIFDLVETLQYRVCKIVPDGIEGYDGWHPELETFFDANFLLVRDDLVVPLGVREGRFDAYNTYGMVSLQLASAADDQGRSRLLNPTR